MGSINDLLKNGGGVVGRLVMSIAGMVAGKFIADKMTRKVLKQQTGFETTEEIMADAQAKAERAQAEAMAQAEKARAEALEQTKQQNS